MPTDYEIEIAKTLVEALVEYGLTDHLASRGSNATSSWFLDNDLGELGFWGSGGATKVCIGHVDLKGWVIKVGYTDTRFDHATIEYNNYCLAEKASLTEFFPTTVYLGDFCGRAFYIQEEAECDEDVISSSWLDCLLSRYEKIGEDYDCENLWDEIDAMDDEEKAYLTFENHSLCDFLIEHDIGDLHEGNFGYIDGRMVIVDFGGYMG